MTRSEESRLFVAVELPSEVKECVAERIGALSESLPPARWVRAGTSHLTLAFLGDTAVDLVPALVDAARAGCETHRPFSLQLVGGGTFPPRRPARVAWVGVVPRAPLIALQADVARRVTEAAGARPERRPYHPHVTLARCRRPWPKAAVESFASAAGGPWGPPFAVEDVVLFESRLGPTGAKHTPLHRQPLGRQLADRPGGRE